MYHLTQLANGLRIATAEMPHRTSVSVGFWVSTGSRGEPAELNGVCHFIEHLLFKGTRRRSARDISQAVEGVGGYLNAFTSEELTCFHAKACHDRFGQVLDVLADMLLHSRFAPADLRKEREVIKEEIAMYLDEPQHQVQELLNATLWPDQPLGRPITGTVQSLDALKRRHLLAYLRDHYVADTVVLVAAGNIRHRQVLRAAMPYARNFRRGTGRNRFLPARENQAQPRVRLWSKKTEQSQLALGIRTCSRHDPRRYALRLLNTILGENMSSRLFQVVREERGLAYSIYSTPSFFHDTGDLVVSAGLDIGNLVRTLQLILRELRRCCTALPSPTEMRHARDYLSGQIDLSLENSESQMNWVGEQVAGYGKIVPPAEVKRRLHRVTASEVRAVARDFFRADRMNLALVSPLKRADKLEALIRRHGT